MISYALLLVFAPAVAVAGDPPSEPPSALVGHYSTMAACQAAAVAWKSPASNPQKIIKYTSCLTIVR